MQLILAIILLLAGSAWAQQDNSVQSSMVFNITEPGTLNIADRFGNKVTITVVPDLDGPVKVDAMKSCQAVLKALQPVLTPIINKYPVATFPAASYDWYRLQVAAPLAAVVPQLDAVKAKLDALFPP